MLREALPKFKDHSLLARFAGRLDGYAGWIIGHAQRIGVDPLYVAAIILKESEGLPAAFNKTSKATGLMQVLPREATAIFGNHAWLRARPTIAELKDPETNIRWGCDILQGFIHAEQGQIKGGVYRYSGGAGSWERNGGYAGYETKYWNAVERYRDAMRDLGTVLAPELEPRRLHRDAFDEIKDARWWSEEAVRKIEAGNPQEARAHLLEHVIKPLSRLEKGEAPP